MHIHLLSATALLHYYSLDINIPSVHKNPPLTSNVGKMKEGSRACPLFMKFGVTIFQTLGCDVKISMRGAVYQAETMSA